jgi:hypothetical protein
MTLSPSRPVPQAASEEQIRLEVELLAVADLRRWVEGTGC